MGAIVRVCKIQPAAGGVAVARFERCRHRVVILDLQHLLRPGGQPVGVVRGEAPQRPAQAVLLQGHEASVGVVLRRVGVAAGHPAGADRGPDAVAESVVVAGGGVCTGITTWTPCRLVFEGKKGGLRGINLQNRHVK